MAQVSSTMDPPYRADTMAQHHAPTGHDVAEGGHGASPHAKGTAMVSLDKPDKVGDVRCLRCGSLMVENADTLSHDGVMKAVYDHADICPNSPEREMARLRDFARAATEWADYMGDSIEREAELYGAMRLARERLTDDDLR